MNKTLRYSAVLLILTVFMIFLASSPARRDLSADSTLPFSCDYYSSPTIATQYIQSADGILDGSARETTTTTAVPVPILSAADVPAASEPSVPADTSATSSTAETAASTTTAAASTTAAQSSEPQKIGSLQITIEKCNVRSDAGAKHEFIKVAYQGENYDVLGTKNADNGIMWFQIDLGNGKSGYVCANFCRFDGIIPGAVVYLTFDDGPTDNTPKILDILDRYNVKATFFVIYHKGREKTYKAIVDRGHTIALHSYTHEYDQIYKSEDAYFSDLQKLSDYVEKVTGVRSTIMRFPGGSSNTVSRKYNKGIMTRLTAEVERRGYSYFDWNLDSGDASGVTVKKSKLIANIKAGVGTGGELMVLMHDAASKTTTVEALPEIIEIFKNHGYDFRRITEDTPPVHQTVAN